MEAMAAMLGMATAMEGMNAHAPDAKYILELCQTELGWDDLSQDVVMDIGSGKEKNCCVTLVKLFPTVERVIAIDKDLTVIAESTVNNEIPQIEYAFADIEKRDTLEQWDNVTKVVSSHCFHQLSNKELAFQNVYSLLKHGGQAAFFFCLQSGLHEWNKEMSELPRWQQYRVDDHEIPSNLYPSTVTANTYKEMLERIGFSVVYCEDRPRVYVYETDFKCQVNMVILGSRAFRIPRELRNEFREDQLRVFLKHNNRNAEGQVCYNSTDVAILVKKPDAASSE